ncbi:MAG TPA: SRPBCC domain-containing protein [Chitinophagaceae bacterium]|nr:SRPBCC domain-containing protein [Chitinophagaceae bacterium]
MNDDVVRIETSFDATREKVWKAWTEPGLILQWFGSDLNGKGLRAKMNVEQGGSYEITFKDGDGTEHTCMGKYLIVEKPKQLSFTWEWKNEPGVESVVNILLESINDSTAMIFEHKNLGTASAHNYLAGWKATFLKLERVLTIE